MFGRLDTINLAGSGYTTGQVSSQLGAAQKYNPRNIVAMAGTNDSFSEIDAAKVREAWRKICEDRRVTIFKVPPTRIKAANARIAVLNAIASQEASKAGRPVRTLPELVGQDGLLKQEFSLDGVHLRNRAYELWRAKLPG